MKISVIVPCYNEERRIGGCLRALLALDYPKENREILVVDNNSTDSSIEVIEKHRGIEVLSEVSRGDFAARNRGLAASQGEVIAFTDADTAPLPNWLERIEAAFEDPRVHLVLGRLRFGASRGALRLIEEYEAAKNHYIYDSAVPELYYGYTCNLAVRRSVFEHLGPFPPVYRNADVVLVRRVVDTYGCHAARFAPDVCVRRLEVATLGQYFAKQHTYGRDLRRYREVAAARPLNNRERLFVFRETIRRMGYSPMTAVTLFALLAVGALSYEAGRLRPS